MNIEKVEFESFSIMFDYIGPEDKPYYRVIYKSSNYLYELPSETHFLKYENVDLITFNAFLATIIYHGYLIISDKPDNKGQPYYLLNIVMGEQRRYCKLQLDINTGELIKSICNLLSNEQKIPLELLLERLKL